VEDARRGLRQSFHRAACLVRWWRSLRRLLWLVGWAFWWLNLWGEAGYERLLEALRRHPGRLPKEVIYLFDWVARRLHYVLHPKPGIEMTAP
jgi:hypothetical protein